MKLLGSKTKANGCPKEFLEVLPLIVNGTYPQELSVALKKSFKAFPECEKELEDYSRLCNSLNKEAAEISVPSGVLFQDIMSKIDTKEETQAVVSHKWQQSLRERVFGWFSPSTVRIAFAFAVLVIIFQATIILHQSKKIATYHTLSGTIAPLPGRISLNVIFNPGARMETIQTFLSAHRAQIVKGPGPAGVYTVSLPTPENLQTFLDKLKSRKDLIQFVEIKD